MCAALAWTEAQPNGEGGGIRMSDSLEIRKIATLTNKYFFSFEEVIFAITGEKTC